MRRLTTPRAAALAGVVFAVLFGTTVFLIHTDMPEGVQDSTRWLNTQHSGIATATALMPFAGITSELFVITQHGLIYAAGLNESRTTPMNQRKLIPANGISAVAVPIPPCWVFSHLVES